MRRNFFLGLDTSNYTTSAAIFEPESSTVCQSKKLLPVAQGELGLRQSDALFHHVRGLGERVREVMGQMDGEVAAVCVSDKPRNAEGSYMPCFLAGKMAAECVAASLSVPIYYTSHQIGHILAALYSAHRLDLLSQDFLALHVSGGTFEILHVRPDSSNIISAEIVARTLDISPGQLIDRTGQMLSMPFPSGIHIEALAKGGNTIKLPKILLKDGCCCLSGMENKINSFIKDGIPAADVARFVLLYIAELIEQMTAEALKKTGAMPIVFSGGVMSNALIKEKLAGCDRFFAEPSFSADNACGVAIAGAL
ncbi:MAG: peptidase M22, partial [Angelakisella sp.]